MTDFLPLPAALISASEHGAWRTPENRDDWLALFPDKEIMQPTLYPLIGMASASAEPARLGENYLGVAGEGVSPGDIDPALAVLIGDLGPDRLLALDYRKSITRPSVIGLTSSRHAKWQYVAADIEEFMRAIKLMD
ncbi:MAG TPA: hypothetical protein VGE52_08730 [Pirellulales bacterium]